MKIYFAGSIRGRRDDQGLYNSMIIELTQYGTVLTEHIGNSIISSEGEQEKTDEFIFSRDMKWVEEADIVVAEVSTPSLGVGYEIGQAESLNKKIICLYRQQEGKRLSAMISGNKKLKICIYSNIEDIKKIFKENLPHEH